MHRSGSKLRITVVTPEFPSREYPNRGQSAYQTVLHLSKYAEVKTVCPVPRYPAHFLPKFDYRRTDVTYSLPEVAARYVEYRAFPWLSRPINGLTCARVLEPHVRASLPDVILNFVLYPAGFAALNIGNKLQVPVVVGSVGSDLNAIPDPVSRWLTRKTLRGASQIITKSEQLRRRAIEMGASPHKLHVVSNGCDDKLFTVRDRASARDELHVPRSAKLIVFVGRMNRVKGVGELLEAVSRLSVAVPEALVAYVGDGPALLSIQEKALGSGIRDRVRFAGACSPARVSQWLAAADVLALPSYAEGSPNAVVEALSSGRPVVASAVGDLPSLIDDSCGLLVPPRNLDALTSGLESALRRSWDHQAIASRFRRSWDVVAQEVLAVCEASLGDTASHAA